jgi:hypothetical protein
MAEPDFTKGEAHIKETRAGIEKVLRHGFVQRPRKVLSAVTEGYSDVS